MIDGKDITTEQMSPWKNEVLKKIDEKIQSFKGRIRPKRSQQVLKDPEVVEYLQKMHEKYGFQW